jgi:hypothetical protein
MYLDHTFYAVHINLNSVIAAPLKPADVASERAAVSLNSFRVAPSSLASTGLSRDRRGDHLSDVDGR